MDPVLEQQFASFGRDPVATELTGASLVAMLLDPTFDEPRVLARLDALSDACGALAPWVFLSARGFRGNFENYDAPENSHFGRVLETGRGLPITLGVLVIHLARTAGRESVGINFPSHFLVRVDDVLVDPFAMAPVEAAACLERLPPAERRRPPAELFAPASAQGVALRMLNNVKGLFAGSAAWHLALEAADAQLAIAPDQPAVQLERGELWLRMGSLASARMAFEDALMLAGRSDSPTMLALAQHLRQRLQSLGGSGDVLH